MRNGRFSPKIFSGAKIGMLTVIERIPGGKGKRSKVRCVCDCGTETTPDASNLSGGVTTSCGCRKRSTGKENAKKRLRADKGYGTVLPGAVFGRLRVVRREGTKHVLCVCSCGNQKRVGIDSLVSSATRSCGCLASETTSARNKADARYGGFSTTRPRTYSAWNSMITRCYREKGAGFAEYGARGIRVCKYLRTDPRNLARLIGAWKAKKPSLDRFPIHDGHYSCGDCSECRRNGWKKNVRWCTRKEQSENRGAFNVIIEAFGMKKLKSQWMSITGLSWSCLTGRLRRGWRPERALATPDANGNCYRHSGSVNV